MVVALTLNLDKYAPALILRHGKVAIDFLKRIFNLLHKGVLEYIPILPLNSYLTVFYKE